jgi:ribonuclease D
MNAIAEDCYLITSNQGLAQAASQWQSCTALGIDTEFIRVDTFFPIPALIQVSNGKQCWLLDVLSIKDFTPLIKIFTATEITKILHAASEDLEVFDQLFGVLPTPLFDTQIAAALCGHGASLGYSRLVQALLDVELSKDQCRSDWLARPLSKEQQHYACLDVLYLPALHEQLTLHLQQLQRTAWNEEENQRLATRYREQRESHYSLDRISQAWRLNPDERKRLWHLVLGRDALARQHNKSRNHIAKDFALLDMAKKPPTYVAALSHIEGIRPSAIRQFGQQLLQLANHVPDDLLCPPLPEPLSKAENELVKNLRSVTEQIATHLQIPAELLIRKIEMENIVRQHLKKVAADSIALPERMNGWRQAVIANALRDEVQRWSN